MAPEQRIRVYPSRRELARAAAHLFVECAREAVKARGRFTVALAGGSTPRDLYRSLADDEALREAVWWPAVHVFWGDERHVPPTHDDSNFGMAREALVGRVPIPDSQVHRILAEGPDAETVAREYEDTIREAFGLADREWPRFDLILLGMGEDGHTASLFPRSPALHEAARLVAAPFVEELDGFRITLTPPVLNHARAVVVLVAGEKKATTLREVFEGPLSPERYPIQCLRASRGAVRWLVEAAAASALHGTSA